MSILDTFERDRNLLPAAQGRAIERAPTMSSTDPSSLQGVPTTGELIAGKYLVQRLIGYGGMGAVISAVHTQLGQQVAIKFLLPEMMRQADQVERFLREARAAVRIQSEHVAKVLDVGETEVGAPFMVMEYLDGRDLGDVLDEQKVLPIDEAVTYVLQACDAIAEAHAVGIIHRDLKPSNLFLAKRTGRAAIVKVLDFGISKVAYDQDAKQTTTNLMMGSPHYMSPEQIRSAKKIDSRSDIWSLGMVLYELLSGNTAFRAESIPALFVAIATESPEPLRQRCPDLPTPLEAAVMRCLEKDPSLRFQTIDELVVALSPFAAVRGKDYAQRSTMTATKPIPLEAFAAATKHDTGNNTLTVAPVSSSPSPATSVASAANDDTPQALATPAAQEQDADAIELPLNHRSPSRSLLIAALVALVLIGGGWKLLHSDEHPASLVETPAVVTAQAHSQQQAAPAESAHAEAAPSAEKPEVPAVAETIDAPRVEPVPPPSSATPTSSATSAPSAAHKKLPTPTPSVSHAQPTSTHTSPTPPAKNLLLDDRK